jgi:hypothetical protein
MGVDDVSDFGVVVCEHQPVLGVCRCLCRPGTPCGCQLPADPRLREGFIGLPDQALDGRPGTSGSARDARRQAGCARCQSST